MSFQETHREGQPKYFPDHAIYPSFEWRDGKMSGGGKLFPELKMIGFMPSEILKDFFKFRGRFTLCQLFVDNISSILIICEEIDIHKRSLLLIKRKEMSLYILLHFLNPFLHNLKPQFLPFGH